MSSKKVTPWERQNALKDRMRKKFAANQPPKKVCLTMIVRNESKNMPRILESIYREIDMISVVDTGSADNTEEVIMKFGKEHNIPTTVHHEPFINFAHNRTHSVKVAKTTYPEADYFLLSDADFIWQPTNFDKRTLVDHKYLVEQFNQALSYWNIRLLSAKLNWECVGVTHEFWSEAGKNDFDGYVRTAKLESLVIDDKEDGGHKTDKFERDERLLREELGKKETPKNLATRYKFYLAQTLKDTGQYEESIEWYQKRVADKGWAEEVFYSKFQIGFNHEQIAWKMRHAITLLTKNPLSPEDEKYLKRWNPLGLSPTALATEVNKHVLEAGQNYLGAYNYRKCRAESLMYLVRLYRNLNMHDMVLKYAGIGRTIVYPKDDTLFIERKCYGFLFDYELVMSAPVNPATLDIGRAAYNRLMKRDDLTEEVTRELDKVRHLYVEEKK